MPASRLADDQSMQVAIRRLSILALLVLGAVYVAWLGFGVQTTGDYPRLFAPSMGALLAGHFGAVFHLLPEDGAGGSVLLRAPGALLGKLLGGGQLAEFRFGALESVLALAGLGLWLARDMRPAGRPSVGRAAVVGLCVIVPALLDAIFFGHPEEPLGAALCVGAVLLADADRPVLAGVVLGLAVINKPWGLFAVAPALLAAPRGRIWIAAVAGAIAALWFATAFVVAPGHFVHSLSALSAVAHPQELWWPLAHLSAPPGVTPTYYLPAFITAHARELVLLLAAGLALPLARRPDRTTEDCLALLALVFLIRCLLDPNDHVYYHVPFVVALIAWEVRTRDAPVLALLTTGLLWVVFHTISGVSGLSVQFLAYLAVTLPLLVVIGRPALGLKAPDRRGSHGPSRLGALGCDP
jgi:hypothetical protein